MAYPAISGELLTQLGSDLHNIFQNIFWTWKKVLPYEYGECI